MRISSVEKVGDDLWRFNAKMDCCGLGGSGAIPIVVPMRFVGDTPVIMMTDTSLPGMGRSRCGCSFTAIGMPARGNTARWEATCLGESKSRVDWRLKQRRRKEVLPVENPRGSLSH